MSSKEVEIVHCINGKVAVQPYTIPLAPPIASNPKKTLPKAFTRGDFCAVLAVDYEMGSQVKTNSFFTKIHRGNLLFLPNCNIQRIFLFPKDIKIFFPRDLWTTFTTSRLTNESGMQKYKEIMAAYFGLKKAANGKNPFAYIIDV